MRTSWVQIEEPSPYGVSLARAIASSKSLKRNTGSTGPNTSSRTSRESSRRLGDDRRLEEPALVVAAGAAADQQLAARGDAVLDLLEQLVAARAGVDRAHPQPRLLGLDRAVAGLVAADAVDELRRRTSS